MRLNAFAALLLSISIALPIECLAGAGSPDASFGTNGMVVTGLGGGYSEAHAGITQPDGKLLLAGFGNGRLGQYNLPGGDFLVARFATNNTLDTSFGDGGKVVTRVSAAYPSAESSLINALGVQSDGKILAAGFSYQNSNYSSFTVVRYNTNGTLDTTFGTNGTGIVTTDFGENSEARALTLQAGGYILLAGSAQDGVALARYDTNGVLDPAFGTGGTGTVITTGNQYAGNAVMQQPDGKIVVAGTARVTGEPGNDFALFRYTTNGVLDSSFGGGTGKVFTRISSATEYDSAATAVATQFGNQTISNPDKIVVAGTYENTQVYPYEYYQTIVRYNLDGTVDSTFGNSGIVTNAIAPPSIWGQHVVGVNVQGFLGNPRKITIGGWGTDGTNYYYTVARFTSAGLPDTTFGANNSGKTVFSVASETTNIYAAAYGSAMTLQSGNFVVVGYAGQIFGTYDFAAARFTSSGLLDTNFGANGLLRSSVSDGFGAAALGTAIQADGRIVAVGQTPPYYDSVANSSSSKFAVARYNTDGSLDSSFGTVGKVTTKIGSNDLATSVAIQPDGKIVVAGKSYYSGSDRFALARYNTDGTPDTAFGTNGTLAILAGGSGQANSVHVQADGKIVAAGISDGGGGPQRFAVARWTSNGVLDTNFGSGGIVVTSIGSLGSYNYCYGSGIGADGKIVTGGLVAQINGSSVTADFAAARYNTNGALDFSFGSFGRTTANVGGGTLDGGYALAIQPDGKTILAGTASLGSIAGPAGGNQSVNSFVALIRFNTNGTPDGTFGSGGMVVTQVGAFSDYAMAIALQPDGKILVGGASQAGAYKFFALRYATNGTVDSSYGVNGSMALDFGTGTNEIAYALALDSFGRAVLAGDAGGQFAVARLTGDFAVLPSLKIWLTGTNTAVVSWPSLSMGWSLQENSSVSGNLWSAPAESINNDGTNNFIVVTPQGNAFYRLKQ